MAEKKQDEEFQSTLPVRGATYYADLSNPDQKIFQSTLPVRGATHMFGNIGVTTSQISIHAPREGSDSPHFQDGVMEGISIHAPREGSDPAWISPD